MPLAPADRLHVLRDAPLRRDAAFVLYWMTAARRTRDSFALDHAIAHAAALQKPLLILEPLRAGYPWASDRLHTFAIQGMCATQARLAGSPIAYYPYVEPTPGEGRGLLAALAADAALLVTDHAPVFFLPRMLQAAIQRVGAGVRIEAIDSNGLLPLRAAPHAFPTAYAFRRFLQKNLRPHLDALPSPDPLAALPPLPALAGSPAAAPLALAQARWPAVDLARPVHEIIAPLPIDHGVPAVRGTRGGSATGDATLDSFVTHTLDRYATERSDPDADAASGLSPYLHWGHVGAHGVLRAIAAREGWSPARLGTSAAGKKEGWWGMSASAEAFLDEAVTWRELGFVYASHHPDTTETFDGLPAWAQATLRDHARDPRPVVYPRAVLEAAETHDDLWNAAQRQLLRDGTIQNYLRMLWGKKVLEWSATPEEALDTLLHLNHRYALDGRDPNSSSGVMWVLGRYDRPWGPTRPIFGTIRYMSSDNTRKKLALTQWLARYGRP